MDIRRPDSGQRRQRRLVVAGASGAGFLFLIVLAQTLAGRPPAVDSERLWSAEVRRGEFIDEVAGVGTLAAPEIRSVTNGSAGSVERILVLPGHAVRADSVLVEMSSPELEEQLADARWKLAAAEAARTLTLVDLESRYLDVLAQVANAEAEYTTALVELQAQEQLGEHRSASAIDIGRLRLRVEQWRKRLDAEQARVDRFPEYRSAQERAIDAELSVLQQTVSRLERRVDDLHVRAGVAGVVQEVNAEEGQRLAAGEAVARIVNPEHLIARIAVSERDASRVTLGLPVRLDVGAEKIVGKVTRIDPTVRERLVTVDVALVSSPLPPLRPDLSVTARIEVERVKDALVLDRPVRVRVGFENVNLFRLDESGTRAERVSVEIGRASPREVEILSGLSVGDRVILADVGDWESQAALRIR